MDCDTAVAEGFVSNPDDPGFFDVVFCQFDGVEEIDCVTFAEVVGMVVVVTATIVEEDAFAEFWEAVAVAAVVEVDLAVEEDPFAEFVKLIAVAAVVLVVKEDAFADEFVEVIAVVAVVGNVVVTFNVVVVVEFLVVEKVAFAEFVMLIV